MKTRIIARWAFTKEVRASIAKTLDKLSWMGSVVFIAVGLNDGSWLIQIATLIWFGLMQILAHVVLGLPYTEEKANQPSTETPNPHSRLATPMERDRAPPQ